MNEQYFYGQYLGNQFSGSAQRQDGTVSNRYTLMFKPMQPSNYNWQISAFDPAPQGSLGVQQLTQGQFYEVTWNFSNNINPKNNKPYKQLVSIAQWQHGMPMKQSAPMPQPQMMPPQMPMQGMPMQPQGVMGGQQFPQQPMMVPGMPQQPMMQPQAPMPAPMQPAGLDLSKFEQFCQGYFAKSDVWRVNLVTHVLTALGTPQAEMDGKIQKVLNAHIEELEKTYVQMAGSYCFAWDKARIEPLINMCKQKIDARFAKPAPQQPVEEPVI